MKKIIFSIFLLCCGISFGQEASGLAPISEDSLQVLHAKLDEMSRSQLMKMKEHFTYRNRIEPSEQNRNLLLYVNQRLEAIHE